MIKQQLNRINEYCKTTQFIKDDLNKSKCQSNITHLVMSYSNSNNIDELCMLTIELCKWFYASGIFSLIDAIKPNNYKGSIYEIYKKSQVNEVFVAVLLGKCIALIDKSKNDHMLKYFVDLMYCKLPQSIEQAKKDVSYYQNLGYSAKLNYDKWLSIYACRDQLIDNRLFVPRGEILPTLKPVKIVKPKANRLAVV